MNTTGRNFAQLERAAQAAHAAGERWGSFWPTVAADLRQLEPHHPGRFHKLVERLLRLVVAGDESGAEPIGSSPWETDDAQAVPMTPHDTYTQARIDWAAAGVVPPPIPSTHNHEVRP